MLAARKRMLMKFSLLSLSALLHDIQNIYRRIYCKIAGPNSCLYPVCMRSTLLCRNLVLSNHAVLKDLQENKFYMTFADECNSLILNMPIETSLNVRESVPTNTGRHPIETHFYFTHDNFDELSLTVRLVMRRETIHDRTIKTVSSQPEQIY